MAEDSFILDPANSTAATVATSTSALESNTIDINSALNGSAVKAWFLTV